MPTAVDASEARPTVFFNGPVFGVSASSVGVVGGRIAAVGDDKAVTATVGTGADRIDLDGRMLLPGFQDAHVHPDMGGLMRLRCNLEPADDLASALEIIRTYIAEHPDLDWVLGAGWSYTWFPGGNPPASMLDALTDKPVMLVVADGHSAWVSTSALDRAGIDASTGDPRGGVIVRLGDGSPQGTLHEAAMDLMDPVKPADTGADLRRALLESQDYLLSLGITAWQDAWVTPAVDAAYRDLVATSRLKARVRGAQWWDRDRGVEQLADIVECRDTPAGPYVPGSVKLMLDGVCENFTGSMLHSYLGPDGLPTGNRGVDFIDPGLLPGIVTAIDAAGLQCHFHALGDRAVRNALDAIEAARRANGFADTRPHIAHLQVIDPADVPRFATLGVAANIQPFWACANAAMTELTLPFLPPGRADLQYPFGSLRDAGAELAMGSDWSVSTPDVLQQVAVAVSRVCPSAPEADPFLPEQRLSREDALRAFTSGSARVNFLDGDSGTIEVGKRADLVVLDGDPLTDEVIAGMRVDLTMIGGEIVFQRSATP